MCPRGGLAGPAAAVDMSAAVHSTWMRIQLKSSCGKCRITAAEIANPSRQNRLTATSAGDRVSQKAHCAGPRLADRDADSRGRCSGVTDKLTGGPASCALLGAPAPPAAAAAEGGAPAAKGNNRG